MDSPKIKPPLARRLYRILRWTLFAYAIFIFSPIAFMFYPMLAGRVIPIFDQTRASISASQAIMRRIAVEIGAYEIDKGPFPGGAYWGPLTPDLVAELQKLDAKLPPPRDGQDTAVWRPDPRIAIDPFNRDGPPSAWRKGPRYVDDHGGVAYIKGGDFQYYSDGGAWWILICRGPDGDLDLAKGSLDAIAAQKNAWPPPELVLRTYDPSNGSISDGDIFRIPD